ncbi:substrate-binding domain-containing protein [Teredinibacter turnerae]|uniref:PAS fold family protein n=1 Tax=Teredinibacter turnerae (strain ATCC 39867 / T7901) TaxID=377629 RepID=C5BSE6_TERTT|nr:substrate-binding domain-containing protein [Teredinibacter turnerae]ACR13459.1 PAS fold family protein [Teredinibacter turnerae T7901]
MLDNAGRKLHIAVFAPYLQGDYMGEIINQLRDSCNLKHYRFSAVRTNGFGEFNLGLGLDQYDGIIVIRNAVSPKLIERIQNRGIPLLAVAHDYFPLDVPIVTSDNDAGTELAFNYLRERGHSELLFVGDITQYDLRKRYERFVELCRDADLNCGTDHIICTPNAIFSGGLAAGREFLERTSRASGVICGAGHTAMGFVRKLHDAGIKCPGDIDVITFDAIQLMQAMTPGLPYVDQNLDVLALRCITTLEGMIHSSTLPTRVITIAPTIFDNQGERETKESAQAQTDLYQLAQTGAVLHNSLEITQDIVATRLDKIMTVAPLFDQFMEFGVLSCLVHDGQRRAHLHVHKIFTLTDVSVIRSNQREYTCTPDSFPPPAIRDEFNGQHKVTIHFPVFSGDHIWGVLTFFADKTCDKDAISFVNFSSFIDNIVFSYGKVLEVLTLEQELKKNERKAPHINRGPMPIGNLPSFEWDLEKGSVQWSDIALELLGFTTELEKTIYRKMEIFDRVHPDDEHKLRKELTASLSNLGTLATAARLKTAEGDYRYYSLQGEILHEEDSRAVRYRCCLSLLN